MKYYIGGDDGYDETKIVLHTGDGSKCFKIASQAKSGEQTNVLLKGGESRVFSYDTDEGRFSIGNIREADPTSFDDYPLSAMNRVIVSHAIRHARLKESDEIVIATGLPLKKFYTPSGRPNKELIEAKIKNLLKNDVRGIEGYKVPKIVKHEVLSEGIAAWMDFVIEEDAKGRLSFNEAYVDMRMAFIDIGGRTTDIAVVKGGELELDRSNTVECGMLNVKNDIASAISAEFGVNPSTEQMREVMDTGSLKLWGKENNIDEIIQSKLKETSLRINSATKLCLKDASDIDLVVFVGGSTNRMEKYLENWFRNQSVGEQPGYANARGMCKFVRMMDQK